MKTKKIIALLLVVVILAGAVCAYLYFKPTNFKNLRVGQDNVKFGKYKWTVLEVSNDRALLITNDIVKKVSFHDNMHPTTWIDSHLRWYLNDKFIKETFTPEERERLIEVSNYTGDNAWFHTNSGGTAKDRVFLLSVEEVVKYFGNSGQLKNGNPDRENYIDDEYNEARRAKMEDGTSERWWTRTMGVDVNFTAIVLRCGLLDMGGALSTTEEGIRPVVWVRLDK